MSIASQLFSRFRIAKVEAERPARERYLEFVKALASGDEVEVDELQSVCESLAIDEKQLQRDIDIQQRRLEAAAKIDDSAHAERDLRRLEAEQTQLQIQRQQVLTPIDARLYQLKYEILDAQTRFSSRVYGVNYLQQNVIDVELKNREIALRQQRQSLMPRLREVEEALNNQRDWKVREYGIAEREVRFLETVSKPTKQQLFDLQKHRETLANHADYVGGLRSELAAVKREFSKLDDEQAAIDREKLKP